MKSPEICLVPNDMNIITKCKYLVSLWSDFRAVSFPPPELQTVTSSSSRFSPVRWQNSHGNPYPHISIARKRRKLLCQEHLSMKKETSFSQKPKGISFCFFHLLWLVYMPVLNSSLPTPTAEGSVNSTETLREWGRAVFSNESLGPVPRMAGNKILGNKQLSTTRAVRRDSIEESTKEMVGVPDKTTQQSDTFTYLCSF